MTEKKKHQQDLISKPEGQAGCRGGYNLFEAMGLEREHYDCIHVGQILLPRHIGLKRHVKRIIRAHANLYLNVRKTITKQKDDKVNKVLDLVRVEFTAFPGTSPSTIFHHIDGNQSTCNQ